VGQFTSRATVSTAIMKRTNHAGWKTDEWLDLLNGLSLFVSISKITSYLVSEAGNLGAEASSGALRRQAAS
jgi:hypothetical protein